MFMQKMKNALLKPKTLDINADDKIIDYGLIAICIIFLQYLIAVEKLDGYQVIALVLFSLAIPMLTAHFLIIQTNAQSNLSIPAYLAKSHHYLLFIGFACTLFGILVALFHSSVIASYAFSISCAILAILLFLIQRNINKAIVFDNDDPAHFATHHSTH